jgi:hypothetical protein
MRRDIPSAPPRSSDLTLPSCAVVGAGRLGTVLATALHAGPALKRDEPIPAGVDVVLLCVPDGKIAAVAQQVPAGPLLAH